MKRFIFFVISAILTCTNGNNLQATDPGPDPNKWKSSDLRSIRLKFYENNDLIQGKKLYFGPTWEKGAGHASYGQSAESYKAEGVFYRKNIQGRDRECMRLRFYKNIFKYSVGVTISKGIVEENYNSGFCNQFILDYIDTDKKNFRIIYWDDESKQDDYYYFKVRSDKRSTDLIKDAQEATVFCRE